MLQRFLPLMLILPAATQSVESILYAAPISDLVAMLVTVILSVSFIRSLRVENVGTEQKLSKRSAMVIR